MDARHGQGCAVDPGELVAQAYQGYGPEIGRFLRSRTRDLEAAEDLTHEAFLRLHIEVTAGRAPDDVRAWLYRVAANLATSRGRRAQVAVNHAPRLVRWDTTPSTEELIIERERDDVVRAALARLPDRDRDVVLLAAAGMSGPELAIRIGRTQIATRTLLCRARGRLRQHLAALELTAESA